MKHRNPNKGVSKGTPSECLKYARIWTGAAKDEN